ncbi:MAG TPA: nuclear transport factor 2 family protein [Terracidiphilus sp.]
MTRLFAFSFASLLSCCCLLAQSPASAPAAAPVAVTSVDGTEVQQFQKIEDAWDDAINLRDQYALELVLSPLFVDVSAGGDITTRNQQLALLITGDDKTLHLEQKVITVRMLGDIAVANGTYILHRKPGGVNPAEERGVFTHVFEHVRGGWSCINSQRTRLPVEPAGKSKKQSTAEMPFHIPLLFGKSDKDK